MNKHGIGCFLRTSTLDPKALECEIEAPKGTCKCGESGYAITHDYQTGVIECLCENHLAILRLQLAMKGIFAIFHPLTPDRMQYLSGVSIHSIAVLTDVSKNDTLLVNNENYGYKEKASYSDVPMGNLTGKRIDKVRESGGGTYYLHIGNCRLLVYEWPT